MLKANELRIGNWVSYDEDDTPFEVIEIYIHGLSVKNSEEETWIEIDKFSAIPLSQEILKMYGYSEEDFSNGKITIIGQDLNNVIGYVIKSLNSNICIKSLHQLQNIFFALTNEELKINL